MEPVLQFHGFYRQLFSQSDVDNNLYGYVKSDLEEHGLCYALSGNWQRSDSRFESTTNIKSLEVNHPQNKEQKTTNQNKRPSGINQTNDSKNKTSEASLERRSLPEGIKIVETLLMGVSHYGVFCSEKPIKKGTRFGPFTGRSIPPKDIFTLSDTGYTWEVFKDGEVTHLIDGKHDANNWLKFVNCARYEREQNMFVIQEGNDVFFDVSSDISEGTELLVWYGDSYLKYMGIPITMKEKICLQMLSELDGDSYACDRCGKVFAYEYYRDKHLKYTRCVDQGDRKFPCNLCNRSFEKRDRLRIHILHVHEKHRPHQCSECGKRFSQSSSLNKHLRVHSGERPYKCPYCIKAFTASSILRTHMRQHSGEKPFKCRHCGKAFASHAAHDSHVRRTHTKEKPCVCEYCGKAFAQSYELKFHLNMHTGEKPYSCERCGRGFSSPSSRDRHRSNFDCTTRKNRAPKVMKRSPGELVGKSEDVNGTCNANELQGHA